MAYRRITTNATIFIAYGIGNVIGPAQEILDV